MPSQLFASRAILPTFQLDTSRDDRPRCAGGDVMVQTPPVRSSAQATARFRRWCRCPPLCQRASLNFAQPLVPTSRDSLNSSYVLAKAPLLASGIGLQISGKKLTLDGRLASGGGARNRAAWTVFLDLHETLCVACFCITPS